MPEFQLDDDDILARLAGGLNGIAPSGDAPRVVGRALVRRKRRRAATAAVTAAAVVVVAGVGSAFLARSLTHDDPSPATTSGAPDAFLDGNYVPADFFADTVGGKAVPIDVVHHQAKGELFYSRMKWKPDVDAPDVAYLTDITVERVTGSRAAACDRLTMGAGTCKTEPDGSVVASFTDLSAIEAFYDPVHRKQPFENAHPGVAVTGVTYLQADGFAVSVWVCNCDRPEGAVTDDPPITHAQLIQVASDPSWNKD